MANDADNFVPLRRRRTLDIEGHHARIARIVRGLGKAAERSALSESLAVYGRRPATPAEWFEDVVVVNLDRRPDRWERVQAMVAAMDWPLKPLRRARAVDGRKVGKPSWWRAGAGAWGCLQSHIQIIEQASMDGLRSVLILEDDVTFCDDFSTRLAPFLDRVPDDWHQIYLGGQHLCQRKSPPIRINEEVIRPFTPPFHSRSSERRCARFWTWP